MPRRDGYRWFRGRWQPSTAQQRVLDGLAAGWTNAEIAVRLGLSAETVKWHVSQLLAQTGCTDREALVRWWQARRERRPAWLPPLAAAARVAGAAVMVTGLVLLVMVVGARLTQRAPGPLPPAATAPVDRGVYDAGRLVAAMDARVQVENRADRAVLFFPAGGVLLLGALGGGGCGPPCLPRLRSTVTVEGQPLTIELRTTTAPLTELAALDADHIQVAAPPPGSPPAAVMVTVTDQDGAPHRVLVDGRGHLLIDSVPLPGDMVIDYHTGEQLDVAGMRRLGQLAPVRRLPFGEFFFTGCHDGICTLSYRVNQLRAPFDGTLRCLDADAGIELAQGDVRLQFIPVSGFAVPNCIDRPIVTTGDVLSAYNAHFQVRAVSAAGEPLSLVAAQDGMLYIGRIAPAGRCPPCLGGS